MIRMETRSSRETKQAAAAFAKKILKRGKPRNVHRDALRGKPSRSALILGLAGELGSGKTTFIQGFLRGLGVRKKITSPTFVLIKRFKIKGLRFKNVYHIDVYRIKKPSELLKLGLREILNNPGNIVLIEWAEKISAKGGPASGGKKILPKSSIWIKFEHGEKENIRRLAIYK